MLCDDFFEVAEEAIEAHDSTSAANAMGELARRIVVGGPCRHNATCDARFACLYARFEAVFRALDGTYLSHYPHPQGDE